MLCNSFEVIKGESLPGCFGLAQHEVDPVMFTGKPKTELFHLVTTSLQNFGKFQLFPYNILVSTSHVEQEMLKLRFVLVYLDITRSIRENALKYGIFRVVSS